MARKISTLRLFPNVLEKGGPLRLALACVGAVGGWSGVAMAQQGGVDRPVLPSAQRPFYVQPSRELVGVLPRQGVVEKAVTITPSVTLGYDDNVYRAGDAEPKLGSTIVSPSLAITAGQSVGVHRLLFEGSGQYNFYTQYGRRSNGRYAMRVAADIQVGGRCTISPDLSYRAERSDYGDASAAVENFQRTTSVGVGAECKKDAGIYPSVKYKHHIGQNSFNYNYANEAGDNVRVGLVLAKPSLGEILAYYGYDHTDRPNLGITNHTDQYGLRFVRAISSILAAKIDASYLDVHSSVIGTAAYRGAGWDVELSSKVIPRTSVILDFTRKVTNDALVASDFTVQTGYNGQVRVAVSDLTTFSLFGDYKVRNFRQDRSVPRTTLVADDFLYFGADVSHRLSDRMTLRASVIRYRRNTRDNSNNYESNQLSLGLEERF